MDLWSTKVYQSHQLFVISYLPVSTDLLSAVPRVHKGCRGLCIVSLIWYTVSEIFSLFLKDHKATLESSFQLWLEFTITKEIQRVLKKLCLSNTITIPTEKLILKPSFQFNQRWQTYSIGAAVGSLYHWKLWKVQSHWTKQPIRSCFHCFWDQ